MVNIIIGFVSFLVGFCSGYSVLAYITESKERQKEYICPVVLSNTIRHAQRFEELDSAVERIKYVKDADQRERLTLLSNVMRNILSQTKNRPK